MKKIFYIFISLIIAIMSVVPLSVQATEPVETAETTETTETTETIEATETNHAAIDEIAAITTPHMILYESDSGSVLYEKEAYAKAYPASTTKIMTCIVALENCGDVNSQYTCGWEAQNGFGPQSSLLGLKYGYVVTIKDMLYGLMLCSGNDCGACLAVATAGSIENFVELMNKKAQEIGMTGTHYTNPHGLHSEEHYTTAYDMALLMDYALKNETFCEIAKTVEYSVVEANGKFIKTIQTSNKLLYTKPGVDTEDNIYEYCIGGKTGETNIAGYCVVEAARKNGVTLVVVLMGDPNQYVTSPYYRFRNSVKLFEYGFDQFVYYKGAELAEKFNVTNAFNIQTTGYPENDPNNGLVTAAVDITDLELKGLKSEIGEPTAQDFVWHEPILDADAVAAPVTAGDKLGTVQLFYRQSPGTEEKLLFEGDLIAESGMNAASGSENKSDSSNIVDDEKSGRRDVCNLNISKNGGNPEYTVWMYYENTLFTMQDGLTQHYLYCDNDVFRSARVPATDFSVIIYRVSTDESGNTVYVPDSAVQPGERYVIVSCKKALMAVKKGRSLEARDVSIDDDGNLTGVIPDEAIWTFTPNGSGYQLMSNGMYLHRSGGDGLLFWILIAVLVISLAVVIHLLVTGKRRKRNPRRHGQYKIYRM